MVRRNTLSLLIMALAALFSSGHRATAASPPSKLESALVAGPAELHAAGMPDHAMLQPSFSKAAAVKAAAVAAAPVLPPGYFGLHVLHLPYGTVWPTVTFGTWRLWDSGVDWRDIQPTSSTYNWQLLDTYVALAQQNHIDLILELGVTPQWASARPNEAGAFGKGAAAEPASNTAWTNYVTAVAKRYKGKIAFYEVWNEANTTTLWTGTPTALVNLTALASKAIKTVDPAAKIISPSLANASPTAVAFLKSLFDVGLGNSIDIVGIHFYSLGKTPEAILTGVQAVQTLLAQYSLSGKPIFNTEFGWAAPNTFSTVNDQSSYLMRSMLVGWGAGVQRFMWYAWDNSNWVTVVMSTPDFKSPTMVAKAYATLQTWTVGNEVSRCAVLTGTVWSCDITDLAGDHSRIYWSAGSSTKITPNLPWRPSKQVDMYGNTESFLGGSLTVTSYPVLIKE